MNFYAVTTTSVYSVSDKRDKNNTPIVKKIALRGISKVSVGGRLKNGYYVGIMGCGIYLYHQDHPRAGRVQKPEEVNIFFWGGHTSPIIALFLKKNKAMSCFNSPDLQIGDKRWKNQTEEVLKTIGNDNPVLIISRWDPILK